MIPKSEWIWFTQNLGLEHVTLSPYAKFSQSTAVGKYVINTIGEILSSLDYAPTEVFGKGLYYQSIVFCLNKNPRGPWDVDYVKGPISKKQYPTKEQAMEGHLDLCEVYSNRSQFGVVK